MSSEILSLGVEIAVAVLCITLGYLIRYRGCVDLIAGVTTYSARERFDLVTDDRPQVNPALEALAKRVGTAAIALGCVILLAATTRPAFPQYQPWLARGTVMAAVVLLLGWGCGRFVVRPRETRTRRINSGPTRSGGP